MGRIVWKALQLVLHVQKVNSVSRASILTVLLEHTTPILGKVHVKRALKEITAKKERQREQYVVLEIIVLKTVQNVNNVKWVPTAKTV